MFCGELDLYTLPSVKYVMVHCGTKNLHHDKPKARANAITKIVKSFNKNGQTLTSS